ncbi:MAG: Rieske (2Fe-2S) protein, partial [Pseudomonadota bacterium]
HNSAALDWAPDQFLDYDNEYIQCANHGALFELHNGYCIYGPCSGQSLQPIKIEIKNDLIFAIL